MHLNIIYRINIRYSNSKIKYIKNEKVAIDFSKGILLIHSPKMRTDLNEYIRINYNISNRISIF